MNILTPNRVRVAIVVCVVAASVWIRRQPQPTPPRPIEVQFIYSDDAKDVVAQKVVDFNALHVEVQGVPIHVQGVSATSGDVVNRMCETSGQADCVSPSVWMPCRDLMVAAARREGQVLGRIRDRYRCSFRRRCLRPGDHRSSTEAFSGAILSLAALRRRIRRVVGGPISFAHARPDSSTSGLHALVTEFTEANGNRPPHPEDVANKQVLGRVTGDERAVSASCGKSGDLWQRVEVAVSPRSVFDVAYVQETTLAKYNAAHPPTPDLEALYPSDAFVADYPVAVMEGAPWMLDDSTLREASWKFRSWLTTKITADDAGSQGFRSPRGDAAG